MRINPVFVLTVQIIWRGQSCFQIITNPNKDNQVVLVIDPFGEDLGLRLPELSADILLVSHDHEDHNNKKLVTDGPFLIEGPGEYEIKGVSIQGIPAFHDNVFGKERGRVTIYTIEAEETRICFLSDLGQKELFPEQIEDIGEVDILLVPVGGNYTINAETAAAIIGEIEPKVVIPMHYALPKLKMKLDGLEKFLKVMGEKMKDPLPKLVVKKKDLSEEEMKIVVLKP